MAITQHVKENVIPIPRYTLMDKMYRRVRLDAEGKPVLGESPFVLRMHQNVVSSIMRWLDQKTKEWGFVLYDEALARAEKVKQLHEGSGGSVLQSPANLLAEALHCRYGKLDVNLHPTQTTQRVKVIVDLAPLAFSLLLYQRDKERLFNWEAGAFYYRGSIHLSNGDECDSAARNRVDSAAFYRFAPEFAYPDFIGLQGGYLLLKDRIQVLHDLAKKDVELLKIFNKGTVTDKLQMMQFIRATFIYTKDPDNYFRPTYRFFKPYGTRRSPPMMRFVITRCNNIKNWIMLAKLKEKEDDVKSKLATSSDHSGS